MNFLRPREEQRILSVPKPQLDDLIIRIPLQTGLSPGEMVKLSVDDVSLEYGVLFVWRSKTAKDHLALCDSETMFRIYEYLDKRQRGPLLILEGSYRMKVQSLRRKVKCYAEQAEISRWKRVTPYTLRHTFCIKWILSGGTLEGLRRQLGHRSLQKLQHYLDFDYTHVVGEYKRIFDHRIGPAPEELKLPSVYDLAEKEAEAQ